MASVQIGVVDTDYDLGDSGSGQVAKKVIEINYGTGPLVGTFTVKGRLAGGGGTFVAIPYRKHYLNAAVADESYVSTAITGNSLIEVNSSGLEVRLSWDWTSGAASATGAIKWLDLIG